VAKCPFCGRRLKRSSRALLSNKFCRWCISDRIRASGATMYGPAIRFKETPTGYVIVEPVEKGNAGDREPVHHPI